MNDLDQKFFQIPENASDALKSVIADIKKQNDKYHFVNQLSVKYGFPAWGKSVANVPVRYISTSANTRSATGDSLQIFLIPFRASDSSVSSYLACARNGDEFSYRYYKKNILSTLYAANDTVDRLREGLLSVFGYFEKRINNKDSLYLGGIHTKRVKNVSISFNGVPANGRSLVNSFTSLVEICYERVAPVYYRISRTADIVCFTIELYGNFIDLGYTSSNGYSSGGGSGGGGSGGSSTFPDGFQCPQSEWWCESGDYREINGALCTPVSYPGQFNGFPWLWWESQVNANESNPNITDNDPDTYWWDDANTTFPLQPLPSWANMNANYPKNVTGGDMPAAEVYSLIGGQPLALYNSDSWAYINACALRVSRALNYSGVTIPNISGHTFQGADNKYYFLSSSKLYNWMKKTFGIGDIVLNQTQGGQNGINFHSHLSGNKGIYILQASYPSQFEALGHTTLFDGSTCIGGNCFFNADGGVHKITLWKLN